jgi:hypothetical protein
MPRQTDETEDRPRRRKKSRSNKSLTRYLIVGGAVGAVVLLGVLILAVLLLWSRYGPAKTTAPAEYVIYNSPEDVFHVTLPKGWKFQYGGRKDTYWVNAEKGGATIKVYESLVGSLLGDIAGAAQPDSNGPDESLPVSRVHDFKQKLLAAEYGSYREEPAVTVETKFGKARRSMFNARGDLGQKLRGYRVTALGGQTQIGIVCTCSPGDWDVLEPAFARAIESVGAGSVQK